MCDKGIRLCTVAGKEGVACWWCLGAARHCRHTHSDVVHNTHADPAGPATTPHVHPSVTSMGDAITHAVRTRQALGHLHSPWERAWERAICTMCLAPTALDRVATPTRMPTPPGCEAGAPRSLAMYRAPLAAPRVAFGHLVGGHTPQLVPKNQVGLESDLKKSQF